MNIKTKFSIGELVFIKTDEDQRENIIVSINIYPNNMITYTIGNAGYYTEVYEFELTREKNTLKKVQ
jgi:hypothetical protein